MELPAKYNDLTPAQRKAVREEYVKLQNGACMYCHGPLSGEPCRRVSSKRINWKLFPPNFLKYPVHLQHCHKTGLTEGAVHAYCNAVMWQYEGR
jgi:hypothetical protein